jgi:flagellar basal body L-ring protein FlgH
MTKSIILISLLFLTSCAPYINRVHQQLDREEMRQRRHTPRGAYSNSKNTNFDLYRQGGRKFVSNKQVKRVSSSNRKYAPPSTKRLYRPAAAVKKRYTTNDLTDNGNTASLWAQDDHHLFQKVEQKRNGDIILIEVAGKLKNEITMELKRAFPDSPKRKKRNDAKKETPGEDSKDTATATDTAPAGNKIHDKISSVVIEEINNDHLLLRGRKHLLYKNRKRLIEIQALVSRTDVSDENSIASDNILESTVNVLR